MHYISHVKSTLENVLPSLGEIPVARPGEWPDLKGGFPVMSPRVLIFFASIFSPAIWAQAPASPFGSSVWCGNVTPSSASVVARLMTPGQNCRLVVSRSAELTAPIYSVNATTAASAGNTVTLTVQGL